jgi:hypothetical protein
VYIFTKSDIFYQNNFPTPSNSVFPKTSTNASPSKETFGRNIFDTDVEFNLNIHVRVLLDIMPSSETSFSIYHYLPVYTT